MTTGMTVYDRVNDPIQAMITIGEAIFHSGMFGCQNAKQGQVLALTCLKRGIPPMDLAERYNIIQGKLSKKYDAMISSFRQAGGRHQVLKKEVDVASIELIDADGNKLVETLTWEEAKEEPFVYQKDGKTLKKNWATPRARRQSLWARVVSEGIRTLAPEHVAGVYTPEETSDFTGADEVELDSSHVVTVEGATVIEDATVVSVSETPVTQTECSSDRQEAILSLCDTLSIPSESLVKILAKRNVTDVCQLTNEQADEIITALQRKIPAAADQVAGESKIKTAKFSTIHATAAVPQEMVDQIKGLIVNKGDPKLAKAALAKIKEHLQKHGKERLSDLTLGDATQLKNFIEIDELDKFFDLALGDVTGNT